MSRQCVLGYCGHGTCTVTLPGPEPTCVCQFGFTNDEDGLCTVPSYYMAGSGFVAEVLLFALVVVMVANFEEQEEITTT